jgi:hypothetical protein
MKIRLMALALVAFGTGAVAQQVHQTSAGPQGEELATLMAGGMRARLPIDLGDGGRITEARSEGNTLIWMIEVPAAQFDIARDRNAVAGGAFREGFCRTEARTLFERGVALRVDITDGARSPVALPLITDCPPSG